MIIPDDRTNLNARLTAMQVGLGVMFFVLVVSFWAIQVLQHDKFLEEAENNHTREIPLRAPRGAMFDRHGKVLVENREAQNISLVREQAQNLDRSMRLLAAVTGLEERSSATPSSAAARCRAISRSASSPTRRCRRSPRWRRAGTSSATSCSSASRPAPIRATSPRTSSATSARSAPSSWSSRPSSGSRRDR